MAQNAKDRANRVEFRFVEPHIGGRESPPARWPATCPHSATGSPEGLCGNCADRWLTTGQNCCARWRSIGRTPSGPRRRARSWSRLMVPGAVAVAVLLAASGCFAAVRDRRARRAARVGRREGRTRRAAASAGARHGGAPGRRPQRVGIRGGAAQGDGRGGDHRQGGRAVRRRGHGGAGRPGRRAARQRAGGNRPHAGAVAGRRRRGGCNARSPPTCGTPSASSAASRACRRRSFASEADLTKAEAKVGVLRAQLGQAQANAQTARLDAQRSATRARQAQIRAPFGGVVVERSAQPGEMISPMSAGGGFTRTGICTIVDMDSIEIEVDVNEAFIGRVRAGGAIEAVLDAYPDWTIPAAVIAVVPTANREKATVKVRIGLKQKDPRILPDMAVKVKFLDDGKSAGRRGRRSVSARKSAAQPRLNRRMQSMSNDPLVRLVGLSKAFVKGKETITIFDRLDLSIPAGDFVAVMGPSGSGKTTLLNLLGGIDRPDAGEIHVAGDAHRSTERRRARPLARGEHRFHLPVLQSDADADGRAERRTAAAADQARQSSSAARTSRPRSRSSPFRTAPSTIRARCPAASSSGSPSRAPSSPIPSFCSATSRPAISTARRRTRFSSTLQILNRELGKTIVMVTHDPAAARYARRTLHLDKGRFIEKESGGMNDFRADPEEPVSQEAAGQLDAGLDLHRLPDLRRAGGVRARVQRRRGRGSRRPAHGGQQDQFHAAVADRVFQPRARHRRRAAGDALQLVRRLLPGAEELPDRDGRGAGNLHGGL